MKSALILLLGLSGSAFAQNAAVTKNPNTNVVTGNLVMGPGRVLTFDPESLLMLGGTMRTNSSYPGYGGQVQVNNSGLTVFGVDGQLTVTANRNHAVIARTETALDGIALLGWSSSGASAVKAVQDSYFTSPALTVWRDLSLGSGDLASSPGVLIAASSFTPGQATTEKAVEVRTDGTPTFQIDWKGFATSRNKPVMRFHGRLSSAPTGTYGTDYAAGDLFFNTGDSKFYCHDGISWKAM
jgi:hypothetical protein